MTKATTKKKVRLCFARGCRRTITRDAYFCGEHAKAGRTCPACGAVVLKQASGD